MDVLVGLCTPGWLLDTTRQPQVLLCPAATTLSATNRRMLSYMLAVLERSGFPINNDLVPAVQLLSHNIHQALLCSQVQVEVHHSTSCTKNLQRTPPTHTRHSHGKFGVQAELHAFCDADSNCQHNCCASCTHARHHFNLSTASLYIAKPLLPQYWSLSSTCTTDGTVPPC